MPGYLTEVHHVTPYAKSHTTDINDLTLACGGHHPLAEQGWTTRKLKNGDTEWIPPPHLDHGQPRTNTYHHPEKLLRTTTTGRSWPAATRPFADAAIDRFTRRGRGPRA